MIKSHVKNDKIGDSESIDNYANLANINIFILRQCIYSNPYSSIKQIEARLENCYSSSDNLKKLMFRDRLASWSAPSFCYIKSLNME